jgi:hypothetical protein
MNCSFSTDIKTDTEDLPLEQVCKNKPGNLATVPGRIEAGLHGTRFFRPYACLFKFA